VELNLLGSRRGSDRPLPLVLAGALASTTRSSTDGRVVTCAAAPVVKVILANLGIVHGCITTIHNVTNTQGIMDAPNAKKTDLRRARCGLLLRLLLLRLLLLLLLLLRSLLRRCR
jgi:hypothetical protein